MQFRIVREQIDTEKKCRTVTAKGDPIISTKYVFCPLIRSLSNCVRQSTEITFLALEGLPLTLVYVQAITNVTEQYTLFQDIIIKSAFFRPFYKTIPLKC